jgi:MFS family permease
VALSSFRPLRSRNFALVWSAALVSNVGSWMQTVALGYVITARTHQPLWTGLVAAAAFLPMGLLAPVGGALADRLDRRRWLIVTTVAEACFAAVLAVLAAAGHAPPLALVGVAFLGGVAAAIGFPTYQAMLPDLVPH